MDPNVDTFFLPDHEREKELIRFAIFIIFFVTSNLEKKKFQLLNGDSFKKKKKMRILMLLIAIGMVQVIAKT